MDEFPIYDSNPAMFPKAQNRIEKKYNFEKMNVNQVMLISKSYGKSLKSIRNLCSYWNKKGIGRWKARLDIEGNIAIERIA